MDTYDDRPAPVRSVIIYRELRDQVFRRTDRMFAVLMILQWVGGIIAACVLTPWTWTGSQSAVHPHVWLAVIFGGVLAAVPVWLAWRNPGQALTRHVIAISQMLFSCLFIHLSGGRIETHFHVFGSLAFLAFYRDWKVLVPATVLVALDHLVRGAYWPESVFGASVVSQWRWLEHAAWVLFEDVFLFIACRQGVAGMTDQARRTAELERINADLRQRTAEVEQAYRSKHAIVETSLDAVVGMDKEGRITIWNSQAEETFGWTAGEALGRPLVETIIPPAARSAHSAGLKRYLETGVPSVLNRRIEVTAIRRDGSEFPVELTVGPVRSGDEISFCAFVRDITEGRNAAEALRQAKDAAEAANRAKSSFLANMSHEIRTPLNGILGFADVFLRLPPGAPEEERREHVQTIHDSGRHLLALINDILDLSKIESGQMEIERVRCAPLDIIAEVVSILRVRAQEKGISLEYRWSSRIPEHVETDPSRLRQLLMNLVGNAVKFTEHGGVEITARIDTTGNESKLIVEVADTGIGISRENLARVFRPFAQADESITRRFGGTGLGLAICHELAVLLGGNVDVSSEVGRGSTFTLTVSAGSLEGVPLRDASVADLMPRRTSLPNSAQRTLPPASILVVEDGETNRKLFSLVLRRAGAKVTTAENGKEGVKLALRTPFDLILMDMQMPIMDGYTATRELRRRGLTLPIIALTAHAMKGDEEACLSAGCTGFLTKPIDSDRLIQAVAEAVPREVTERKPPVTPSDPLSSTLPLDDPEFREIVEEFLMMLPEKLAEMQAFLRTGDLEELGRSAHWLKGAGGTVGFDALTQPAATIERLAKDRQADFLEAALAELQTLCDRIALPSAVR